MTHPIPGNDDAVKSIRIIVDTLVEAVQKGLAQRDTRRAARGAADLKAASAAVAAAAGAAGAPAGEVDLKKIELPAHLKDITVVGEEVVVAEEGTGKIAAKKKPIRAVKKAEGEE